MTTGSTKNRQQDDPGAASGGGPGGSDDGSGGLPLRLVGGAVAVASIVGGVALYRWRSQ